VLSHVLSHGRFHASQVGLWTLFRFVRMVIGCLRARASGCLQMSRYRGSEGGLAPGLCGLGTGWTFGRLWLGVGKGDLGWSWMGWVHGMEAGLGDGVESGKEDWEGLYVCVCTSAFFEHECMMQ
jgi:hypothetical protein